MIKNTCPDSKKKRGVFRWGCFNIENELFWKEHLTKFKKFSIRPLSKKLSAEQVEELPNKILF
jgi:hypothetical protein